MRRLLCFLPCCLLFFFSQAQDSRPGASGGAVTGRVLDSASRLPIEYATVMLFTEGSQKPLTGTTSDSSGIFRLPGLQDGRYTLTIEFIGYKKRQINSLTISLREPQLSLGNILLTSVTAALEGVTVTGRARLIENRIDKMVFNAEADLTSQSGAATDLLKKIPQVSVDADGNVELAGTGGIRFLINGKPSTAFGSNVADVLQSIPASQIKSIEVITNPGARYDAEGMGGIINILLKQSKVKGINGNLSLTSGTRNESGSLNLNLREGKLGLNAFVSGNSRLPVSTPLNSERNSLDTALSQKATLSQEALNRFRRYGLESGIGFDWSPNKHDNFSGNVNYEIFGSSANGNIYQSQAIRNDLTGNLISGINTLNRLGNHSVFHTVDASVNYKKTFAKEDRELEISANTSLGDRNSAFSNRQSLLPQDSAYYGIDNRNFGTEKESQFSIDFTEPLTENAVLAIGGRLSLNDIVSNANVLALQPLTKRYAYDSAVSNFLDYHQKVYALYAELTLPVKKWFDAKIGTRYERTGIRSFYSQAQQQQDNPGYNTWVPSVYLSRKLSEKSTIKLSYSKRIERPDYGDLNPFINTSDPKNVSAGNPFLLPELGKRYELAYNSDLGATGSFMASLFYRINKNDIQPYVAVYPSLKIGDSVFTNVAVSTRENIGIEKNMGLNLFGDLHPTSKLGIRTNLSFFRRYIINGIDKGRNPTSYNYRANVNFTYEFTRTLVSEFFGNFNSARNELQGKYPSFTTYSLAIRKQFWQKKGSLALVGTNFLSEYVKQRTVLFGTNFTTETLRQIPFRSIGLNFTWKFGKLEFKKDKEEGGTDLTVPEIQN